MRSIIGRRVLSLEHSAGIRLQVVYEISRDLAPLPDDPPPHPLLSTLGDREMTEAEWLEAFGPADEPA